MKVEVEIVLLYNVEGMRASKLSVERGFCRRDQELCEQRPDQPAQQHTQKTSMYINTWFIKVKILNTFDFSPFFIMLYCFYGHFALFKKKIL